ncbi:MAG: UTP--glucose-1-phosphate uridylyltransferase [Streptomyces sp.]|uniref:UTP--glucose-1-phosphate uridylyltransferase n=1 Tax=Streptomyces sp. TaxID=1931 RepID=UPI0025F34765|nr:UTP--glucose-1-phosphate uridylyltransferase [Streptomyces sp.]MBW8797385.1 UTP--glucose-1-phosphate uridylyltransferase [Streptomyces sp.]
MTSNRRIMKAVIPAAGLGTRFLPATKAVPKEMLPVVDRPAIQYVVEEAVSAGLSEILMVTGRNKRPLEDHFDRSFELENALQEKGDVAKLSRLESPSSVANIHYLRQGDPRGLGHAVLRAASYVGDDPFAVLLGDDLIDARDDLLTRMTEVHERHGGNVLGLMKVGPDQISRYGCAAVTATEEDDVLRVTGLVEKPSPALAPSNFAVLGRYVLAPDVFAVLRRTKPGRGGEIQLTDALGEMCENGTTGPVHGVVFSGRRYDTGDPGDYLRAVVRLAWEREDLGPGFRAWLGEFVGSRVGLTAVPEELGAA